MSGPVVSDAHDAGWLQGQRLLVTGASGFFGRKLIVHLLAQGAQVVAFDPVPPGPQMVALPGLSFHQGSLLDQAALDTALAQCDGVFHLAGISRVATAREKPGDCVAVNIQGMTNLLEAVRTGSAKPWLCWTSTTSVHRTGSGRFPTTLYAVTKLAAEMVTDAYVRDFGLRVMTCFFPELFGSGDDHPGKVHMIFARRSLAGLPLEIRDAEVTYDYVHVRDAVETLLAGADAIRAAPPGAHERVRLTSGRRVNLVELARAFIRIAGSTSPLVVAAQGVGSQAPQAGDDPSIPVTTATLGLEDGIRILLDECRTTAIPPIARAATT